MHTLAADSVAALSLIGLVTSSLGLVSALLQGLGWIRAETITAIAVWLALNIPIITAITSGLVVLACDYGLDYAMILTEFKKFMEWMKSKPQKKTM